MLIGLMTGARPGAIRDLKWSQVDFAGRLIKFHAEGATINAKRRATVPIAPLLFGRLVAMFNSQYRKTDYVLETYKHGNLKGDLVPAFRKASLRAKIKHASPHVLRHTVATWLAQAGIDAWKISRLLGHSFGGTTSRYMHHDPNYLKDVTTVLENACAQFAHYDRDFAVIEGCGGASE